MAKRPVFLAVLSLSLVLFMVLAAVPQAALATPGGGQGPRPDVYALPGDEVFPEGIAFQNSTGYFYVSSTTDGTVFRGHVKDEIADVFLPGGEDGRTTAVGLEVDRFGRLFVAGGGTGQMFVYNASTGALIASFDNGVDPTFINDVATTKDGYAYFTESAATNPVLYRLAPTGGSSYILEEWLDFTGTPIQYQSGFNLNGIVATEDGRYLIVVQSNTGKLFRISIDNQEIVEIDLGGTALTAGDGLVLQGRTLYVVRNALGEIAEVRLSGDLTSGSVVDTITDDSFAFPTTAALARGRLLVVNSQFNQQGGDPEPFTVSSVKR